MSDHRFDIAGRTIGPGEPPYVVAEMSANHGGDFDRAVALVEAASAAGADAVKLQTYTPDGLTLDCPSPLFRIEGTPWAGRSLYELYQEAAMPWAWQPRLAQIAAGLGLTLFSTAYDAAAVDFLETLDVPAYKIASFELVDPALLRRVAATRRPVILSTGMATFDEIDEAVRTLRGSGARKLALLHCTSAYPAPADAMNLHRLPELAAKFGCPVGLSDHSREPAVPVAAVALGASIVEKHLTLESGGEGFGDTADDSNPQSPIPNPQFRPTCDASFSLSAAEFREMVRAVRAAWDALGEARDAPGPAEAAMRRFRRSLFVVEDVKAGEPFTPQNVRAIRPAAGLPPKHLDEILGRPARRDLARGTPLGWEDVG